ncbi:MAG: DUF4012 domain-containing protein [Acidimicrobiales bacterium]|nr:DUF4012 domain-containing protein [Acidimicrobiales bacterium]
MTPHEGESHTGLDEAGVARSSPVRPGARTTPMVVACLGAVAAVLAPVEPTATSIGDAFWLAAIAAIVTLAATRAHPIALVTLCGAAGATTTGWAQVLAAVALVIAFGAAFVDLPRPQIGSAIAGALAINAALRAEPVLIGNLATALVVTAGVGAVLVTAYLASGHATRRLVHRTGLIAIAVGALFGGITALTVLVVRGDLERGVELAQAGVRLAADADPDGAADQFGQAQDTLSGGHRWLNQPWLWPALALPVVGPNLDATTQMARAGTDLADSALRVSDVTDPTQLAISGSQIDIEALADAHPHLVDAREQIAAALATIEQVRSPWLLPPLASRIDGFESTLADALPTADTLLQVAEITPPMLGIDGPRTYALLLSTPAETRGLGGFVGNWGLLVADGGRITLERNARIRVLSNHPDRDDRTLSGPADFLERYDRYHPTRFFQNLTASPDFPTVAGAVAELFPQAGTPEIDGVILADPAAIAALVAVVGPVEVPELDQPLTGENTEEFLLHGQYLVDERVDALTALFDGLFDQLDRVELDPQRITSAFAPVVDTDRLMIWSAHPDEAAVLAELGIDGAFPRVEPGQDLLSVRTANANPNKIDVFLQRDIDYEATIDASTGELTATVGIELTNDAVDDPELPGIILGNDDENPRGTNRQWVSVYTPHDLVEMRVDGQTVEAETLPELGVDAHATFVNVPPQGRVEIEMTLRGEVDPDRYRLTWAGQPTVNPDRVRFEVDLGDRTLTLDETTSSDLELAARPQR